MALRPNRFLKKDKARSAAHSTSSEWKEKRRVFHPWMGGLGVLLLAALVFVRYMPDTVDPPQSAEATDTTEARGTLQVEDGDVPAPGNSESSVGGETAEPPSEGEPAGEALPILSYPSLETIRAEVAADPHGTPASLRAFARGLAPWMRTALSAEATAETVGRTVDELARCALPPSGSPDVVRPLRLLCMVNLQRIRRMHSDRYPESVARIQATLRAAPRDLLERLQMAERLGEGAMPSSHPQESDE